MSFRIAPRIDAPDPDRANPRQKSTMKRVMFRIVFPVASVVVVAGAVIGTTIATRATSPQSSNESSAASAPMSTSKCLSQMVDIACYTPVQYRVAYDLNPLYSGKVTGRPLTGAGETIVFLERGGSPTIGHDLRTFDAEFGIPNPKLTIDKFGHIPPFDPNNPNSVGNAEPTTLAVEYAHAIAPGANLVIAETAAGPTESGLRTMMNAADSLIKRGIGDVMVLDTFGVAENSFPGFKSGNYSSLLNLRYAFEDAYTHHVTVLVPAGDGGPTGLINDLPPFSVYPYRVVAWPASDPLVTTVGGTALHLNNSGNRLSPDVTWADVFGASGGGESTVFSRPQYQNAVAGVVGAHRGMPDISLSAQPGAWGYYSFAGGGGVGWHIFSGTDEATPMMAGIVALADQAAGHPLGLINPALYKLGEQQQAGANGTGIVSVTSGATTFDAVKGYHAGPGYNLATGWGTIDAAQFVPALARLG
jgi:subtilase family serine protease